MPENRIEAYDPVTDLELKSQQPIEISTNLMVVSQQTLEYATELRKILKGLMDEVDKVFNPIVESAHKAHKTALEAKKKHREPLEQAERALKQRMDIYLNELDKIRKKAEEENQRSQKAKIEEGQQAEIFPAARKFVAPPAPVVQAPPAPRIEGLSTVDVWLWEVEDINKIPAQFWMLDEKAITEEVNRDKEKANIPGIRVWSEKKSRVRT